jgi:hypothetical protein
LNDQEIYDETEINKKYYKVFSCVDEFAIYKKDMINKPDEKNAKIKTMNNNKI